METKEMEEIEVSEMENVTDPMGNDIEFKEDSERRKDPTPAELKEYFKQVDERKKMININKGAKEFTFDDGFSCISRDQVNADRKHNNWINGKR